MLWPWPVPPPACLPVVHPSASVCCTSYPMSSPAPKLPTSSFLPANLHVSYPHLYLMEKLSEQVPLPACPLSSVCLHAGLRSVFSMVCPPVLIRVLVVPTFTQSQLSPQLLLSSLLYCFLSLPTQSLIPLLKSGISPAQVQCVSQARTGPETEIAPVRPPCLFLLLTFL